MKTKLPLKASVLKAVADLGAADTEDIMNLLGAEYGKERQFSRRTVGEYLLSLKAVGLIEEAEDSKYSVAPAGKSAIEKLKSK